MKIVYFGILVFFFLHQRSNGAVVRKQPAFAKPTYSDSYLPAAMQVIFHAVDQLKNLEAEENEEPVMPTTMSVPTTSPHAPGQHQPTADDLSMQWTDSPASADSAASAASEASTTTIASDASTASIAYEASTVSIAYEASIASSAYEAPETPTASVPIITAAVEDAESSVTPEQINDEIRVIKTTEAAALESETPEGNYGTPETNHEIQEPVQEIIESNQEVPEKSEEATVPATMEQAENSSLEIDDDKSSSEESNESKEEADESKSLESSEIGEDKRQSVEEEDDEIRFTLIGEKVSQVPRPSLTSYLRKAVKSPIRGSIQELATLYDALSKDARKQGLAKFSGYSDEVLKTLESTMESGVGPQLRTLLEKAVERNDLTREDTKIKVSNALNHLSDPASTLSRDLRRLVPLHFVP